MRIQDTVTGDPYNIAVDHDGDVRISGGRRSIWFTPANLVAALRAAGVDLSDPDTPAESTPEPSDRVRVSWRASAADDTERAHYARLAAERLRRQREERLQRGEGLPARRGGRFFRDRDGDVWRQNSTGRMRLVMFAHGERPDTFRDVSPDMVRVHFGPLREIPSPSGYGEYRQRWITGTRNPETAPTERKFRNVRGESWVMPAEEPDRLRRLYANGRHGGTSFPRSLVERTFGPLEERP